MTLRLGGDGAITGCTSLEEPTISISGLTMTTPIEAISGTAAAPSYTFSGDTDNGLYYAGTNSIGVSTAGTNAIVVDASQRVGIGTTSPGRQLQINGDSDTQIRVVASAGGAAGIQFGDANDSVMGGVNFDASDDSLQLRGFNNSERMRIDSSGRLLAGTSSTSESARAIFEGNSFSSAGGCIVKLSRGNATPNDGGDLGNLQFTDSNHGFAANISAKRDGGTWTSGSSQPTRLEFSTTADGASSPTERLRIDSSGRLLVGLSSSTGLSSNAMLTVDSGSSSACRVNLVNSGSSSVESTQFGSQNNDIWFNTSTSERLRIDSIGTCTVSTPTANYPASPAVEYYSPPGKYMLRLGVTTNVNNWVDFIGNYQNAIGTGTYIRFRPTFQNTSGQAGMYFGGISTTIQNTDLVGGKVTSGSTTSTAASITELFRFRNQGGLTFNGDTGDANALDDYEEGTFTPTLYGSTTNGTFTPASQNGGIYTKIGNIVHCQINVQGSLTGAAGSPRVSGLPFTSAAGGSGAAGNATYSTGSLQYWNNSGADMMGPLNQASSTYIYFHSYDGDSSGTATVNNSTGHNLHCCVTYRVA